MRRKKILNLHLFLLLMLLVSSCHPKSYELEPTISIIPQLRMIDQLPPAFEKPSPSDLKTTWGKELYIAHMFAREFDLYRAVTAYKRALILLPPDKINQRQQIQYDIILCYYLGQKYREAIEIFETSDLLSVSEEFPAYHDLMVILYDSYGKTNQNEKALHILNIIEQKQPEKAQELLLFSFMEEGNIPCIESLARSSKNSQNLDNFLGSYREEMKSVRKAQLLNTVIPGAGYLYVGQKKSALTSLIINTLFTAAAWQFFDRGYIAAGLITTSFEMGWYFGGINGAGLEAKEYNQRLYEDKAKNYMIQHRLFPVLMLETTF